MSAETKPTQREQDKHLYHLFCSEVIDQVFGCPGDEGMSSLVWSQHFNTLVLDPQTYIQWKILHATERLF